MTWETLAGNWKIKTMTAAARKIAPEPEGFEMIEPPRKPADVISYSENGDGAEWLVGNAETQLRYISFEYVDWLATDIEELQDSWRILRDAPTDSIAFLRFHRAVHTVYGNAPSLNCECASQIAKPLTRLLERAPDVTEHKKLIDTAVGAIALSASPDHKPDYDALREICRGLQTVVDRWIERSS